MRHLKISRPVSRAQFEHVLRASVPPHAEIRPAGKAWKVAWGTKRLIIRLRSGKKKSKIIMTPNYPWWVWVMVLVGMIAVFIGMFIYDQQVKELREGLKARLQAGLQGARPGVAAATR
jgi:hypothetical protein